MKISIVQTKSNKGEVQKNIQTHLQIVKRIIKQKVDLIIFPELSITGYEPDLAKELATDLHNAIFSPFQKIADETEVCIGIGMPTKSKDGINISMLIFQPNEKRLLYSKGILHEDELPYFATGNNHPFLDIKGKRIALGICYETLQREHFIRAVENQAEIYIASVAKPERGIQKAYLHFPSIAKEFGVPVLMSNCIGYCDNFLSTGQSSVWNNEGNLIENLDEENQGFIIYDTELNTVETHQTKMEKGNLSDLEELFQIYLNAKGELEKNEIYQWTDNYPTISIIEDDLAKGVLYTLRFNNEIVGAINISEEQEFEYKSINWQFDNSKILVIHRLVVNPKHQRQGYANELIDFAEEYACINGYSSIRLDAYSQNKGVINMYEKRNYHIRGEIYFPEREFSFHCMEKEIKTA